MSFDSQTDDLFVSNDTQSHSLRFVDKENKQSPATSAIISDSDVGITSDPILVFKIPTVPKSGHKETERNRLKRRQKNSTLLKNSLLRKTLLKNMSLQSTDDQFRKDTNLLINCLIGYELFDSPKPALIELRKMLAKETIDLPSSAKQWKPSFKDKDDCYQLIRKCIRDLLSSRNQIPVITNALKRFQWIELTNNCLNDFLIHLKAFCTHRKSLGNEDKLHFFETLFGFIEDRIKEFCSETSEVIVVEAEINELSDNLGNSYHMTLLKIDLIVHDLGPNEDIMELRTKIKHTFDEDITAYESSSSEDSPKDCHSPIGSHDASTGGGADPAADPAAHPAADPAADPAAHPAADPAADPAAHPPAHPPTDSSPDGSTGGSAVSSADGSAVSSSDGSAVSSAQGSDGSAVSLGYVTMSSSESN